MAVLIFFFRRKFEIDTTLRTKTNTFASLGLKQEVLTALDGRERATSKQILPAGPTCHETKSEMTRPRAGKFVLISRVIFVSVKFDKDGSAM